MVGLFKLHRKTTNKHEHFFFKMKRLMRLIKRMETQEDLVKDELLLLSWLKKGSDIRCNQNYIGERFCHIKKTLACFAEVTSLRARTFNPKMAQCPLVAT